MIRIIGIDPGSHHTGWGIIDAQGSRLSYVAAGSLDPPPGPLMQRLCFVGDHLDALLQRYRPHSAAIEMVFHAKNAQSALILGQSRGVALLSIGRFCKEVVEYSAGQIKQAATGFGRADKQQVQKMVKMLLALPCGLTFDASDALAAAICHAISQKSASMMTLAHAPAAAPNRKGRVPL